MMRVLFTFALAVVTAVSGLAQGPVLEELARELALETGLAVRIERDGPDAAPVLRIGPADAPTVALVDRTLVALAWAGLDEDPRAARALALARTVVGLDLRSEPDALWASGERGLAILLGPGVHHDERNLPRFDLNFPLGWAEARAAHGQLAGVFPAERPDVAAIVDWLLAPVQDSCIAVLEVGGAAADAVAPHGALGTFVVHGLERGHAHVAVPADAAGAAARLSAEARSFALETVAVERVGADSWLCDVAVRVVSPAAGRVRPQQMRCRFDVALTGAGPDAWVGCALEDHVRGVFTVLPFARGPREMTLSPGPEGRAQRLRIIVHGDLRADPDSASLQLCLRAPGVVTVRHGVRLRVPADGAGHNPVAVRAPVERVGATSH